MKSSKILAAGAAAVALTLAAASAQASVISGPPPSGAKYNLDLTYPVSDLVVFNNATPFSDFNQGFPTAPAGSSSLSVHYLTPGQLTGFGFPAGTTFDVSSVFLLGVASNLPGDPAGQDHLVVFTNDAFASSAKSIAFGTLFPNTNETTLINDLETQTNPGDLFTFAGGDAASGPNGAISFAPGQSFTAIAFSGGQIVGTGTSTVLFGAVPETGTWVMLILGLGLTGAMLRQRRPAHRTA